MRFLLYIILVEAITEIVTKSEIFEPLRAYIFRRAKNSFFFTWLHKLLDCGYCFSMWSGMLISILFLRDVFMLHWSIDWFIMAIVLHRLSNMFHNIMDVIHDYK